MVFDLNASVVFVVCGVQRPRMTYEGQKSNKKFISFHIECVYTRYSAKRQT